MTLILAIESSCDETAVAILKNGTELLANTVNTQIEDHKRFGGVYPALASRLHLKNITKVIAYALSLKGFDYHTITHVAVTGGPGLPGALQIGVMAGKTIAEYLNVPLISVHHLAGHIYANEYVTEFKYPLIALIASGGNSEIVYLPSLMKFEIIGETEDDAIGEAFDKVARELGLPYPGGVNLENATMLEFWARGEKGGEKVNFFMGGIKNKPFSDTGSGKREVTLKKTWTRYRIPLDGEDLSRIKTAFDPTNILNPHKVCED